MGFMSNKTFNILSIDGGGILGYYSAKVLDAISRRYLPDRELSDQFDLIAGTSTGGIIALGLSIGMKPEEIAVFYRKFGKEIFPRKNRKRVGLFKEKFANKCLYNHLFECFGDKTLGDSKTGIVIPAINTSVFQQKVFKANTSEKLFADRTIRMVDVAMATSAAPIYLPKYHIDQAGYYIDGGLWQNNPSFLAIFEALCYKVGEDKEFQSINLLSIGNPLSKVKKCNNSIKEESGILSWMQDIVLTPMKISSSSVDQILTISKREKIFSLDKYLRITSEACENVKILSLDNSDNEAFELMDSYVSIDANKYHEQLMDFFKIEEE